MLICMASSRWCLYTGVFLPTLLLVLLPWKYFLKCDYTTTAGVPTPCSTESQNQPAGGRLDVKPSHWPDTSKTSGAPFLSQNRLTKVLMKPLCQKNPQNQNNQPKPKSNPRQWNRLWNFSQITASTERGAYWCPCPWLVWWHWQRGCPRVPLCRTLPWGTALSTSAGAGRPTACQHRHCTSQFTLAKKICLDHQASCSLWDEGWKQQGFMWRSQGSCLTHERQPGLTSPDQ